MTRSDSTVIKIERVTVAVTVLFGWLVSAGQLLRDGWTAGGGTAWLLAMSAIATLAAWMMFAAQRAGRHGWTAVGLAAVAVSPTVFAYILNVAILVLALVEIGLAVANRRHAPGSSQSAVRP
jgi:hypothetical protein